MRILVVEDEPKIARVIKKALQQDSYAVDLTADGDEALAMAESLSYDVLIVDRMLPGMDGLDLVRSIRKANVHTPILVLTALGSIADKTAGLDSGADDYMVKPFAIEELLARIRALSRRPPVAKPTVLKIADLTLDTASREVRRQGKLIELTSKESALLEYLMRNPSRPLSKQHLINHVWDFDANVLPNTVEVYIKYLREKIDKPFKQPLIQTVYGVGYTLTPPKGDKNA